MSGGNGTILEMLDKLTERIHKDRKEVTEKTSTMDMHAYTSSHTALALSHIVDVLLAKTLAEETHRAMERAANPGKFGL